jgi:hypothetical protein
MRPSTAGIRALLGYRCLVYFDFVHTFAPLTGGDIEAPCSLERGACRLHRPVYIGRACMRHVYEMRASGRVYSGERDAVRRLRPLVIAGVNVSGSLTTPSFSSSSLHEQPRGD